MPFFGPAQGRWESIIDGDIGDAFTDSNVGTTVDDIILFGAEEALDGSGDGTTNIVALAAVVGSPQRSASDSPPFLPGISIMVLDSSDIDDMIRTNQIESILLHEMAHALGFGLRPIWESFGLLEVDKSVYKGGQANEEWTKISGCSIPSSTVPLNDTLHWSEACLGDELMTAIFPDPVSGRIPPLSSITIGSMADLGYSVNFDCADPYTPPTPLSTAVCCLPPTTTTTSGSASGSGSNDDDDDDGGRGNGSISISSSSRMEVNDVNDDDPSTSFSSSSSSRPALVRAPPLTKEGREVATFHGRAMLQRLLQDQWINSGGSSSSSSNRTSSSSSSSSSSTVDGAVIHTENNNNHHHHNSTPMMMATAFVLIQQGEFIYDVVVTL
jgi:hypothetical protein